jgi:hypothetical protein
MLEKAAKSIFLIFVLWGTTHSFHYFYLVWFRKDEYLQQIENSISKWQKNSKFFVNFRKSPPNLTIARLLISFGFLIYAPLFIFALLGLFEIWFK